MADDKSTLRALILPGVIGILGTLFGGVLTGYLNVRIAREKYQSDFILRAMAPASEKERLATLRFMIDANLVTDKDIREGVQRIISKSNLDSSVLVPQIPAEGTIKPEAKLYSLSDLNKLPDTSASMISENQLKEILPSLDGATNSSIVKQINRFSPRYQINTPERLAAFIGEIAFESNNFSNTEERFASSASQLMRGYPNYFNDKNVSAYEGHPDKIASRIYAGKMGNGDEASGDGWKYHGRGCLLLTGKDAYADLSKSSGIDLLSNPDLLKTEYPLTSACSWWVKRGCNALADKGDFAGLTKRINGGTMGMQERRQIYDRALKVLRH